MNDPFVNLLSLAQTIKNWKLLDNSKRSKFLGQHFLVDPNILRNIVNAAGDLNDAIVLEIGPGPGGLTREILRRNPQKVIAIEKDAYCCEALKGLSDVSNQRLVIFNQDALKIFPLSVELHEYQGKDMKVISNLPYNVGTRIFVDLLCDAAPISAMVLMFQREVAERILARPGEAAYGRLSIIAQYLADIELVMNLSPKAFIPPPKVYSSVLRIVKHTNSDGILLKKLLMITQIAFQARRKMLRHSFKKIWNEAELAQIFTQLNLSEAQRPETLTVSDFVALANRMKSEKFVRSSNHI